jgi:D-glycero-D-manno-heptose 1,7-bisphosphate phosphatase
VFLDRDGVLIEDVHLLVEASRIRILPTVVEALDRLHRAGLVLVVVSNQPVVARGLIDAAGVEALQGEVERRLAEAGAPKLDGFYYCPHHPNATVLDYRRDCECRKPRPGMLLRAAAEHGIDLAASFMVGDRPTDVAAGRAAGARTVQVLSGEHAAPLIVTAERLDSNLRPDHRCKTLADAADWILASLGDSTQEVSS